jgi:hypothetical protein
MPLANQSSYVFDPTDTTTDPPSTALITNALSIGTSNKAGGIQGITIDSGDVIIGEWDSDSHTFTPGTDQPDAVRVIARRDGSANGPISTFLARVLGIDTVGVSMDATAALTGQSTSDPGELELPVGISRYFFRDGEEDFCNESIVFSPTNDPASCAGWNSFDLEPPNDNKIREILDGTETSDATQAYETEFEFIGGDLSNPTFDELLLLFMREGYDINSNNPDTAGPAQVDGDGKPITGHLGDGADGTFPLYLMDKDGILLEPLERAYYPDDNQNPTPRNYHRWETSVVVYDWDDCANPNTNIRIVGYAKVTITDVQGAPDKRIVGKVQCDLFSDEITRGGGGEYGVKGTIPGLVE